MYLSIIKLNILNDIPDQYDNKQIITTKLKDT